MIIPRPTMRIGLLATGDELVQGDILNTNGQRIAQQLIDHGFMVGTHMLTSDQQAEIVRAIRFLLQEHQVIMITGGLGPTSDDRTRFALAEVINQDLHFDEATWQAILARSAYLNIKPHPSNRQQALFPSGAHILANPHGTAAGCRVNYQAKTLFLLPGPPQECQPMFTQQVLPWIQQHHPHQNRQVLKWRLLGVIEAEIAADLDALVKAYPNCLTGYRIDTPYLEFKLYCSTEPPSSLVARLDEYLAPYRISSLFNSASEQLKQHLADFSGILHIQDLATGGLLQATLSSPHTQKKLCFNPPASTLDYSIQIEGLQEFWETQFEASTTTLHLNVQQTTEQYQTVHQLPLRHSGYFMKFVVEFLAREIYHILTKPELQ